MREVHHSFWRPRSFRVCDDPPEDLVVRAHHLAELFRRIADRYRFDVLDPFNDGRRAHGQSDIRPDLFQNVRRSLGRGHEREPGVALEPRQSRFGQGRHVGNVRIAPWAGYGENSDLAFEGERQRGRRRREHRLNVGSHQRHGRRHGPGIGDVNHVVDARRLHKALHPQERRAAGTGRRECQSAGSRFGQIDEFLDGLRRQIGRHQKVMILLPDDGYRLEILQRVIGKRLQMRGDHQGVRAHQQRVAVSGRVMHGRGDHDPVGAGTVLDHHRRIPNGPQFVGDDAGQEVGRTAGRKTDHDPDRPVRKV